MERLCASDTTRRLDVNVVMETWAIHKTARIEGAELDATIVIGGASAGDMAGVAITGTVSGAVILQPGALPGLAAIKGGGGGVVVTASADAAATCRSGRARNGKSSASCHAIVENITAAVSFNLAHGGTEEHPQLFMSGEASFTYPCPKGSAARFAATAGVNIKEYKVPGIFMNATFFCGTSPGDDSPIVFAEGWTTDDVNLGAIFVMDLVMSLNVYVDARGALEASGVVSGVIDHGGNKDVDVDVNDGLGGGFTLRTTFLFDTRDDTFSIVAAVGYESDCFTAELKVSASTSCRAGDYQEVTGFVIFGDADALSSRGGVARRRKCGALSGDGKLSRGRRYCDGKGGASGYDIAISETRLTLNLPGAYSLSLKNLQANLLGGSALVAAVRGSKEGAGAAGESVRRTSSSVAPSAALDAAESSMRWKLAGSAELMIGSNPEGIPSVPLLDTSINIEGSIEFGAGKPITPANDVNLNVAIVFDYATETIDAGSPPSVAVRGNASFANPCLGSAQVNAVAEIHFMDIDIPELDVQAVFYCYDRIVTETDRRVSFMVSAPLIAIGSVELLGVKIRADAHYHGEKDGLARWSFEGSFAGTVVTEIGSVTTVIAFNTRTGVITVHVSVHSEHPGLYEINMFIAVASEAACDDLRGDRGSGNITLALPAAAGNNSIISGEFSVVKHCGKHEERAELAKLPTYVAKHEIEDKLTDLIKNDTDPVSSKVREAMRRIVDRVPAYPKFQIEIEAEYVAGTEVTSGLVIDKGSIQVFSMARDWYEEDRGQGTGGGDDDDDVLESEREWGVFLSGSVSFVQGGESAGLGDLPTSVDARFNAVASLAGGDTATNNHFSATVAGVIELDFTYSHGTTLMISGDVIIPFQYNGTAAVASDSGDDGTAGLCGGTGADAAIKANLAIHLGLWNLNIDEPAAFVTASLFCASIEGDGHDFPVATVTGELAKEIHTGLMSFKSASIRGDIFAVKNKASRSWEFVGSIDTSLTIGGESTSAGISAPVKGLSFPHIGISVNTATDEWELDALASYSATKDGQEDPWVTIDGDLYLSFHRGSCESNVYELNATATFNVAVEFTIKIGIIGEYYCSAVNGADEMESDRKYNMHVLGSLQDVPLSDLLTKNNVDATAGVDYFGLTVESITVEAFALKVGESPNTKYEWWGAFNASVNGLAGFSSADDGGTHSFFNTEITGISLLSSAFDYSAAALHMRAGAVVDYEIKSGELENKDTGIKHHSIILSGLLVTTFPCTSDGTIAVHRGQLRLVDFHGVSLTADSDISIYCFDNERGTLLTIDGSISGSELHINPESELWGDHAIAAVNKVKRVEWSVEAFVDAADQTTSAVLGSSKSKNKKSKSLQDQAETTDVSSKLDGILWKGHVKLKMLNDTEAAGIGPDLGAAAADVSLVFNTGTGDVKLQTKATFDLFDFGKVELSATIDNSIKCPVDSDIEFYSKPENQDRSPETMLEAHGKIILNDKIPFLNGTTVSGGVVGTCLFKNSGVDWSLSSSQDKLSFGVVTILNVLVSFERYRVYWGVGSSTASVVETMQDSHDMKGTKRFQRFWFVKVKGTVEITNEDENILRLGISLRINPFDPVSAVDTAIISESLTMYQTALSEATGETGDSGGTNNATGGARNLPLNEILTYDLTGDLDLRYSSKKWRANETGEAEGTESNNTTTAMDTDDAGWLVSVQGAFNYSFPCASKAGYPFVMKATFRYGWFSFDGLDATFTRYCAGEVSKLTVLVDYNQELFPELESTERHLFTDASATSFGKKSDEETAAAEAAAAKNEDEMAKLTDVAFNMASLTFSAKELALGSFRITDIEGEVKFWTLAAEEEEQESQGANATNVTVLGGVKKEVGKNDSLPMPFQDENSSGDEKNQNAEAIKFIRAVVKGNINLGGWDFKVTLAMDTYGGSKSFIAALEVKYQKTFNNSGVTLDVEGFGILQLPCNSMGDVYAVVTANVSNLPIDWLDSVSGKAEFKSDCHGMFQLILKASLEKKDGSLPKLELADGKFNLIMPSTVEVVIDREPGSLMIGVKAQFQRLTTLSAQLVIKDNEKGGKDKTFDITISVAQCSLSALMSELEEMFPGLVPDDFASGTGAALAAELGANGEDFAHLGNAIGDWLDSVLDSILVESSLRFTVGTGGFVGVLMMDVTWPALSGAKIEMAGYIASNGAWMLYLGWEMPADGAKINLFADSTSANATGTNNATAENMTDVSSIGSSSGYAADDEDDTAAAAALGVPDVMKSIINFIFNLPRIIMGQGLRRVGMRFAGKKALKMNLAGTWLEAEFPCKLTGITPGLALYIENDIRQPAGLMQLVRGFMEILRGDASETKKSAFQEIFHQQLLPENAARFEMLAPISPTSLCLAKTFADPTGYGYKIVTPAVRLVSFSFSSCFEFGAAPSMGVSGEIEVHFDLPATEVGPPCLYRFTLI